MISARFSGRLLLGVVCCVLLAWQGDSLAQTLKVMPEQLSDKRLSDTLISLDLRDIEVSEALKYLATKVGLNIIPTKDVSGRITLMVENVPAKDVFDIMLRSNKLAYEKQGNIYNIMTEQEYKNRYGRNFTDFRQVRVFQLQYAIPEQTFNMLNNLKSDIGKLIFDPDTGTLLAMDTPEKILEMQEALRALEQKSVIHIFDLKYAQAKDIEEQLKSQLDLKKVGSIKADIRTNQVVVQTLPERMDTISKLIEGLDKKTKEILIDAKIVQVSLSNQLSSGIEWEGIFNMGMTNSTKGFSYLGSYPFSSVQCATDTWRSRMDTYRDVGYVGSYPASGTTTNFAAANSSLFTENMHLGLVNNKNDFDVILNYLSTLGNTRILSNPKLAVVNNQEAKIHVGEKQAYITTTTTQSQTTTTVSESVTYVDVGIQLHVTPTINDEGFITIKVKPEISSVLSYLETSSDNRIPIISTSTAETIVMVKDGTSILVGGLSKEEKVNSSTGTPILGSIPFLGNMFKNKTDRIVRTELLVLITPHIIQGDELVTGYDRDLSRQLDKQYQNYQNFTEEAKNLEPKSYQGYPGIKKEPRAMDIKPARNF